MGRGDEEDKSDEERDAETFGQDEREAERAMAWQSMRILKRFSLPDLLRTVPGGDERSIRRWVKELAVRGYVRHRGWTGPKGAPGAHRMWHLIRGLDEPSPPRLPSGEPMPRKARSVGDLSDKALSRYRTLKQDGVNRVEEETWVANELRRLLLEFEAALASGEPGTPGGTPTSRWAWGRPGPAPLGAAA